MRTSKKFVMVLEKFFSHRFKLARLTKNPVIAPLAKRMLFEKNNLTILPKDSTIEIEIEKHIEAPENIVIPSQVVNYFIDKASAHFIMDFCICRESMNCKDHPSSLGCLFMGEAVHEINSSFGRILSKGEARKHVKTCRENGLVHVIGRDKLDELWLGVSSGVKLLTVCNCCSCCCLWKMIPNLDSSLAQSIKRMPGVSITVTSDCVGCGTCTENVCFIDAIRVKDGKALIPEDCRICGRCAEVCPNNAIKITIEDEKYIDKTIQRIQSSIDVS